MYRTECILGLKDLSFKGRWSWMPFNIAIPPLNFLVGNLLIATLAQAPVPSSNASNPCFPLEDKEIDASLHELHSTESIFSHIRRSCRRYALPSNNQRASIRMNYKRTCSDIGTSSVDAEINITLPTCMQTILSIWKSPIIYTLYKTSICQVLHASLSSFQRDGKQRHFLPEIIDSGYLDNRKELFGR
jgi:hypothetical protein